VIPTYNEAQNIEELIPRIESSLKGLLHEIIIVDDGSPDGTADVAESLGRRYGNIRVLRRPKKMGLASAIADGLKIAKGEIVAVMDADLQHPPELLSKMLRTIREGYDLVIASRYVGGGRVEGWSPLRRLISRGATILAHLLLPETRGIRDPLSGYFMVKRDAIEGIELSLIGYKLLLEVLVKRKGIRIVEVPYTFRPRKKGESKLKIEEIINYAVLLLKLRLER